MELTKIGTGDIDSPSAAQIEAAALGMTNLFTYATAARRAALLDAMASVAYETSDQVVFDGDPSGSLSAISQANSADLSVVALVDQVASDRTEVRLFVDGNRDNNATVTAIQVLDRQSSMAEMYLGALNADVGIEVLGNSERISINAFGDHCGTGLLIQEDSGNTPDELNINAQMHDCDVFVEFGGSLKTSAILTLVGEQSNSWGLHNSSCWLIVNAILRAVGKTSGGGYLQDGATGRVQGRIMVVGGSDANCAYAADIQDGYVDGLSLLARGDFAAGARVMGGVEGTLQLIMEVEGASGHGLELGDVGTALNGFVIEPGSTLYAPSGSLGLVLTNATNCQISPSRITRGLSISSTSSGNSIMVPRRDALSISYTNNRTECDNVVVLRGLYTLAQLNALSTNFKGMKAEAVSDYNGAWGYYNGSAWAQG